MTKPVHASDVLIAAVKHMHDRSKTYDKPEGERSMAPTVTAFNAITGHNLTEEQGWLLMGLLKMVRTQQGEFRLDNYQDEAAYAGLRAEAAYRERVLLPSITPCMLGDRNCKCALCLGKAPKPEAFDEARADIIGQNGNDGEHYDAPLPPMPPEAVKECVEKTRSTKPRNPAPVDEAAAALPKPTKSSLSHQEVLATIAEAGKYVDPTGKPSWETAPGWANYLAQNEAGVWTFFQYEPAILGKGWIKRKGLYQEFNSGGVLGDWKASLCTAPGLTRT